MLIRNMEERDLKDVHILYESLMDQKSDMKNMIEKFSLMSKKDNYILIVDKEYRKKGISKQMFLELESRAKELGCTYAILVSGKQRKEAYKLYESLGYGQDEAKGFRKFL